MSKTAEMPPGVEVQKNPVVEGARKAVRGALETNKAWRDYRDTLHVKTEKKSVYRAWADAADNVVGSMTKADQEKIGTKLYEVKMRLAAGAFFMASTPLDIAVNVLSWIPRKGLILGGAGVVGFGALIGAGPIVGGPIMAVGAGLAGVGRTMDIAVEGGLTRKIGLRFAKYHEQKRIWKYNIGEAKMAMKHGGELVKERMKQIVEGFAYPEGKPVNPPPAKV